MNNTTDDSRFAEDLHLKLNQLSTEEQRVVVEPLGGDGVDGHNDSALFSTLSNSFQVQTQQSYHYASTQQQQQQRTTHASSFQHVTSSSSSARVPSSSSSTHAPSSSSSTHAPSSSSSTHASSSSSSTHAAASYAATSTSASAFQGHTAPHVNHKSSRSLSQLPSQQHGYQQHLNHSAQQARLTPPPPPPHYPLSLPANLSSDNLVSLHPPRVNPSFSRNTSSVSSRFGSIATDTDGYSVESYGSDLDTEPEDICDRGLAISLVNLLMTEYDLADKTVREVVRDFVLPETEESGMSVAGVMKRYYHDYVGRAAFYVSYPWDAKFGRLVKALAAVDAANDGGNYFWFDVFAIDQHRHMAGYQGREENEWEHRDETLTTVRNAINTISRTVLFLDPPTAPMVVNRSWCLYECMQSLVNDNELILCVTPEPPNVDTMGGLISGLSESIAAFTPNFDASLTTHTRDKNWLNRAVAAVHPGGSRWLNEEVGVVLLSWLCDRGQEEFARKELSRTDIKEVESLHRLGTLCEELERVEDAEDNLLYVLHLVEKSAADPAQLGLLREAVRHDLACLWAKHFDRLKDAEDMLRDVLEKREALLGPKHNKTIETVLALARLLQACHHYDEAESLFRRALSQELSAKGSKHRDTLITANCLALLLQKRGELDESKVLFERALQAGISTLGHKHPDVLVWSNNLAVLYQDKKDYRKAERLFRKTLTLSEQELGPNHLRTLNIVYNLGQCLWQMGRLRAAETLFRREMLGCEAIDGPNSKSTQRSIKNLAKLLRVQCREKEANEMLMRLKGRDKGSLSRQASLNSVGASSHGTATTGGAGI